MAEFSPELGAEWPLRSPAKTSARFLYIYTISCGPPRLSLTCFLRFLTHQFCVFRAYSSWTAAGTAARDAGSGTMAGKLSLGDGSDWRKRLARCRALKRWQYGRPDQQQATARRSVRRRQGQQQGIVGLMRWQRFRMRLAQCRHSKRWQGGRPNDRQTVSQIS